MQTLVFNFKNKNLEGCEEIINEITSRECYGKDDLPILLLFHSLLKIITNICKCIPPRPYHLESIGFITVDGDLLLM